MAFFKINREGISYLGIDKWDTGCRFIANVFGYYINIYIPFKLPEFYIERGKWKMYGLD